MVSLPKHIWNYLRVRGEYSGWKPKFCCMRELPPRARRIRCARPHDGHGRGTTSACAENTGRCIRGTASSRNYLRVRGEYTSRKPTNLPSEELPPRARRIPFRLLKGLRRPGTTSACAENTHRESHPHTPHRNYLRVRGEYISTSSLIGKCRELPPRARRIHRQMQVSDIASGTTSACAENTATSAVWDYPARNYLRVRGEYALRPSTPKVNLELPPRARRILGCGAA